MHCNSSRQLPSGCKVCSSIETEGLPAATCHVEQATTSAVRAWCPLLRAESCASRWTQEVTTYGRRLAQSVSLFSTSCAWTGVPYTIPFTCMLCLAALPDACLLPDMACFAHRASCICRSTCSLKAMDKCRGPAWLRWLGWKPRKDNAVDSSSSHAGTNADRSA